MTIKISALPTASAINPADNLVIVQSGVTKKILHSIVKASAAAGATSIYNASGVVLNNGIATVRGFSFSTDLDLTYNPSGYFGNLVFGSTVSATSGAVTASPGSVAISGGQTASGARVTLNYNAATKTFSVQGWDGSTTKTFTVTPFDISVQSGVSGGVVQLYISESGIYINDTRPGGNVKGLQYVSNYSGDIILSDSSITDTRSVKLLRQDANTWTTGTRPATIAGRHGFNTTTSKFEGYTGTTWVDLH